MIRLWEHQNVQTNSLEYSIQRNTASTRRMFMRMFMTIICGRVDVCMHANTFLIAHKSKYFCNRINTNLY